MTKSSTFPRQISTQHEQVDDPFVSSMDKYPQMPPELADQDWEKLQKGGTSASVFKLDPKTGKPPVLTIIR